MDLDTLGMENETATRYGAQVSVIGVHQRPVGCDWKEEVGDHRERLICANGDDLITLVS